MLNMETAQPLPLMTAWRSLAHAPLAKPVYRYMHFGDSLTQGDGDARNNAFGARDMTKQVCMASGGVLMPVRNGGVGGQPSMRVAARLLRDCIKFQPDLVGLTAGTNNIVVLGNIDGLIADYQDCHDMLLACGIAHVVTDITPRAVNAGDPALVAAANAEIKAWAASAGVPFASFYDVCNDPANDGHYKANYSFDGTHPITQVSALMAAAVWNVLEPYLLQRRQAGVLSEHSVANLLFPSGGINTDGSQVTTTAADGLFKAYRTFTQNGFSLPVPRLFGTQYSGGTAPTVTATVGTDPDFVGNAWSITATPNGAGSYNFQSLGIIDVSRYQGRKLRWKFKLRASGFDVDNTYARMANNSNSPLASAGMSLAFRDSAAATIANVNFVDPIDATATLGQASSLSMDWQALPFVTGHCYDIPATLFVHEVNVPPGARDLNLSGYISFLAGSVSPVTITHGQHEIVDIGPADVPHATVSKLPKKSLLVTAAKTISVAEALSIDLFRCNSASGAFALTLPVAASCRGLTIDAKKINAEANNVTVTAAGSDTIDGAATYVLSSQYQIVKLTSTGSGWDIV